jgi:putative beta-lactamase-like, zn-dependent hydrolase protein
MQRVKGSHAGGKPTEVLPGVRMVAANGHTPGHVGWLVDDRLLLWGDIVHFHAVQFARPQVYLVFDSNAPAAIASRKRLFAEAARHDWWVGGAHLPFPGLGHVVPYGKKSYHWVRGEFSPLP